MELPAGQWEGAPNRETCVTNPSTDIAGLMAVLPRLLALPNHTTTSDQRAAWLEHLSALPSLPIAETGQCVLPGCKSSNQTGVFSRTKLVPVSQPAMGSAALAALKRNMENTELYAVQPFRLIGVGKPGVDQARQAYVERTSVCNTGWCQVGEDLGSPPCSSNLLSHALS
jgi:alpha-L-fucosidase 2